MHKSRHTVGILSKHPLSPGYHFLFLKSCFIKSVFLEPLLKGMMMIKHFILKHDQMEIYVKKKCKGKNKRVMVKENQGIILQYIRTMRAESELHKIQGQGRTTFTKGLFVNTVWM